MATGIEAASPGSWIFARRHAGADCDRADPHVAIKDVPAFIGGIEGTAAGEFGHGAIKASRAAIGNCAMADSPPIVRMSAMVVSYNFQCQTLNVGLNTRLSGETMHLIKSRDAVSGYRVLGNGRGPVPSVSAAPPGKAVGLTPC
jgi:hypothetical protein